MISYSDTELVRDFVIACKNKVEYMVERHLHTINDVIDDAVRGISGYSEKKGQFYSYDLSVLKTIDMYYDALSFVYPDIPDSCKNFYDESYTKIKKQKCHYELLMTNYDYYTADEF